MVCPSLFLLHSPNWHTYTLIQDLITKLYEQFDLKKLDVPKYYLGIELHYLLNGLVLLTQSTYIKHILRKVNMSSENGRITPMFSHCKLSKHGSNVLPNSATYK